MHNILPPKLIKPYYIRIMCCRVSFNRFDLCILNGSEADVVKTGLAKADIAGYYIKGLFAKFARVSIRKPLKEGDLH